MHEDKYMQHATSHKWLRKYSPERAAIEFKNHPVCPRCESIALRDIGWESNRSARCPKCGWSGRALTLLETYLKEGLYR